LEEKKPEELAAYIKGFDVALNPQKVNEINRCKTNPLKIR